MRLSVLDQSAAVAGRSESESIRDTLSLAAHCEALGYHRFWLSEHHNIPAIVGSAPEILMAAIAATTTRIRIGSAGVMLPHYSALKVAEQFRVLARPRRSLGHLCPRPLHASRPYFRPSGGAYWDGRATIHFCFLHILKVEIFFNFYL